MFRGGSHGRSRRFVAPGAAQAVLSLFQLGAQRIVALRLPASTSEIERVSLPQCGRDFLWSE
jgi:hypothetical protein